MAGIIGIPIIIGMPPHIIITGMPIAIMLIMRLQQSMNMSFDMPSMGIIRQFMPSGVMSQLMRHIIGAGIMPIIGIMPPIIGFIIGMSDIMGMPDIMGIGIMPPVIDGIMPPLIGMGMGIIPVIIIVSIPLSDSGRPPDRRSGRHAQTNIHQGIVSAGLLAVTSRLGSAAFFSSDELDGLPLSGATLQFADASSNIASVSLRPRRATTS
jgi:hypothetical protein